MELIYKNNYGKAEYDAGTKTLRTQYIGIAHKEHIIDLLRKVIDFAENGKIKHMIANLTLMNGTFTGALDFFESEFYPHMIGNGLETYAMAVSNDVFTKFAATQLNKRIGGKLDWHVFPSLTDAEVWTKTQIEVLQNS
ncbi:hypothetical protein [Chondrinema litorale]|uniref:hypothetical protein n=1 Tax=Chondrinema litorale TaxID=2994555 RepID=UPI0025431C48|nr:hypothetical protein [Chondrinema litorale]UZR99296.1 hypothetical protein OQ292_35530 [Chondrinema litorale]